MHRLTRDGTNALDPKKFNILNVVKILFIWILDLMNFDMAKNWRFELNGEVFGSIYILARNKRMIKQCFNHS